MIWGSTNPDFGSSWMSMVDLDRDGDPDILYTNGDAFEYAPPNSRPWQGVQWLENKGGLRFDLHRMVSLHLLVQVGLFERVTEMYGEPAPAEVNEAIAMALGWLHPEDARKILILLAGAAKMGYDSRRYEESLESVETEVPVLTRRLGELLADGDSPVEAMSSLAISMCGYGNGDPTAPRSIDTIDGLPGVRDQIAIRACAASLRRGARAGDRRQGELPAGVEPTDVLIAWRIGFLVRGCVASMPSEVEINAPPLEQTIAVDKVAVEEATAQWWSEHPEATDEEVQAVAVSFIEDPRFQLDRDGPLPGNGDGRWGMFVFDRSGRLLRDLSLRPSHGPGRSPPSRLRSGFGEALSEPALPRCTMPGRDPNPRHADYESYRLGPPVSSSVRLWLCSADCSGLPFPPVSRESASRNPWGCSWVAVSAQRRPHPRGPRQLLGEVSAIAGLQVAGPGGSRSHPGSVWVDRRAPVVAHAAEPFASGAGIP